MIEFKEINYEAVTVGEEFMSDDFLIKPEDVETFAFAVDDHDPWYFERLLAAWTSQPAWSAQP